MIYYRRNSFLVEQTNVNNFDHVLSRSPIINASNRTRLALLSPLKTHLRRRDTTCSTMETPYKYKTSLHGHSGSIIALSFSFDGRYLATGSENGTLIIYTTLSWVPLMRFVDLSPLTSLAWHPSKKRILFCGFASGDVHTLMLPWTEVSAILQGGCRSSTYTMIARVRHSGVDGSYGWTNRFYRASHIGQPPRCRFRGRRVLSTLPDGELEVKLEDEACHPIPAQSTGPRRPEIGSNRQSKVGSPSESKRPCNRGLHRSRCGVRLLIHSTTTTTN